MKLLIVTPVFPPEISVPSREIKEMSLVWQTGPRVSRLSILALGRVSEQAGNARITLLSKHQNRMIRMVRVAITSFRLLGKHDILYAHEGVNSSLPALLSARLRNKIGIFHFTKDEFSNSSTKRILGSLTFRVATRIVASKEYYEIIEKSFPQYLEKTVLYDYAPLPEPQIPFDQNRKETFEKQKNIWKEHAKKHLNTIHDCIT